MEDIIKTKVKKLYELSQRGINGEKTNAQFFLDKLLKKYNITLEEAIGEKKEAIFFNYKNNEEKQLLHQIIAKVCGDIDVYVKKGVKRYFIKCTEAEKIEILELFDFYKKLYATEQKEILKSLMIAFIHKHKLFATTNKDNENTDEDYKPDFDVEKVRGIMQGLKDETYQKKLTNQTIS